MPSLACLAPAEGVADRIPVLMSADLVKQASAVGMHDDVVRDWTAAGAIFALDYRGAAVFPAFQFRDAAPLPVIREVLRALPETYSPDETANWFVTPNPALRGLAPVDRLDSVDDLVAAASTAQ